MATYAAPHAGQAVVVRLDLEGFFASVGVGRVYGILRTAGYPEPVAHCLAGLVTTVLPLRAWQALANLAAHRLDVRLTALAHAWGGRFTRYADDLAFSGGRGWRTGTSRLLDLVAAVVRDEGFRLNGRKTAVLPRAGRQVLGGLVVNDRPHVGRADVDLLKAVLHNCIRHGPSTQNREGRPDFRSHLTGRVAWVSQHDAVPGARLREQLAAVDWTR